MTKARVQWMVYRTILLPFLILGAMYYGTTHQSTYTHTPVEQPMPICTPVSEGAIPGGVVLANRDGYYRDNNPTVVGYALEQALDGVDHDLWVVAFCA